MICIIALFVFAVLAIFSAKYRPLAAEAFDCVFRRVTFRKCRSGLDKRLRSQITGKLMKKSSRCGRWVYKHFEWISWFFLIILILSVVQTGISIYNYAAYGNCNGPDEEGFCIFDPMGSNKEIISQAEANVCPAGDGMSKELVAPNISLVMDNPKTGSSSAPVTVIEFGCFACPNTAEQAPAVEKLIKYFGKDMLFIYVDFPLPSHEYSLEASEAARCVYEQDPLAYWKYHFKLFENREDFSTENFRKWATGLGLDGVKFDACLLLGDAKEHVEKMRTLGVESGVYGTPTFFINGVPVVGLKPYKLLKAKINSAMEK